MPRPLKVVHVEAGRHLYGGALQACYLAGGLGRRGVESLLVCPAGSEVEAHARARGVAVQALPMGGDLDLNLLPRLLRLLRREAPDVLHLHSRRGADVLGGLAGRLCRLPVVLSRRVDNPEPRAWAALKYRLYHRVVAISGEVRRVLLRSGVPAGKIRCIPSAVDARAYGGACQGDWFRAQFGLKAGDRPCGVIAQLIPRKGHRHLIAALPAILAREPRARFVFFGRGPERARLEALCRAAGVAGAVRFAGFRDDLPALLPCLELVVHPVELEGLGVALLQAAAAGVPVVASRVGGIPEVVADGLTGVLLPPARPAALADAVVGLLQDPDRARRLGQAARRRVAARHAIEAMVEAYLGVYRELDDVRR